MESGLLIVESRESVYKTLDELLQKHIDKQNEATPSYQFGRFSKSAIKNNLFNNKKANPH